jgi:hypothetical protein
MEEIMNTGRKETFMGVAFSIIAAAGMAVLILELGRRDVPQKIARWISEKIEGWKKNGVLERARKHGTETEHSPD